MDKRDRSKVKNLSSFILNFKTVQFFFPLILLQKKSKTHEALVVSISSERANPIGVLSPLFQCHASRASRRLKLSSSCCSAMLCLFLNALEDIRSDKVGDLLSLKEKTTSGLSISDIFYSPRSKWKESLCLASNRRSKRAIVESFSFTPVLLAESNLSKSLSKLYIHQSGRHGKEPWGETDGGCPVLSLPTLINIEFYVLLRSNEEEYRSGLCTFIQALGINRSGSTLLVVRACPVRTSDRESPGLAISPRLSSSSTILWSLGWSSFLKGNPLRFTLRGFDPSELAEELEAAKAERSGSKAKGSPTNSKKTEAAEVSTSAEARENEGSSGSADFCPIKKEGRCLFSIDWMMEMMNLPLWIDPKN
ncbi:hypothetical protein SLEP1_g59580 [Rubroshorea leprosula]|uniref:Uncharacterized protein n=1 Tax=Rubroshorea leprosula TaxID=152421 RepID=A0AAV5MSS4_9ROSI|nr:hypothetical protein SLEP1_g59580 [Rubroshorea leprosula]